jgi:hypothetical protein
MLKKTCLCLVVALLGPAETLHADFVGKADYSGCRYGVTSGVFSEGSFATKSQCESFIKQQGLAYCVKAWCESTDSGSGSSSGGSTSSLDDTSSRAIAHGLVNGNAQTLGAGLAGMAFSSLLKGNQNKPSPQQLQQQENARQARWAEEARLAEEARRAEAERRAAFERRKNSAVADLKGGDADLVSRSRNFDDLKGLDDDESPQAKYPRLKSMANPLNKEPQVGDSVGVLQQYDTWEEAAGCTGTTAMDHDQGQIACCPKGYSFYCGNLCYSSAAMNDHRVPCNGILQTGLTHLK